MSPLADAAAILRGKRVVALTGAGISTDSGIPDYRSPASLARARKPIQGPEFARSGAVRTRYWARSVLGYPALAGARPNAGHRSLVDLEERGVVASVITQNVDRLHTAAGSRDVIELHGAIAEVGCLDCAASEGRGALQLRLVAENRAWIGARADAAALAPDGDADLDDDAVAAFRVVACLACGGRLKPRVVFFGDNVAKAVVEAAFARVDAAGALLVVGSSLTVFSGYRFVLRAATNGTPIVILNRGETRGDHAAAVRVDAAIGEALPDLARRIAADATGTSAQNFT